MDEKRSIWIPIQLNNPESERATVLFGAKLAGELGRGIVLSYFKAAGPPNEALLSQNGGDLDPVELIQGRDEIVVDALVGYQTEIYNSVPDPPPVRYRIFTIPEAGFEELNGILGLAGMIVFCKDNLLPDSFTWIDKVNVHILNNGRIPVLLHTPGRDFSRLHRIVYGFREDVIQDRILHTITDLFDAESSEIVALYITENLNTGTFKGLTDALEQFKSRTGYYNMKLNTMVIKEGLNPSNLIHSFAFDREADLIVQPRKQQETERGLIRPGTFRKQAFSSDIPLMIC